MTDPDFSMTNPDDDRVVGDEEPGLDPSQVTGHVSEADEADVIEQATVVPVSDDDGFDR